MPILIGSTLGTAIYLAMTPEPSIQGVAAIIAICIIAAFIGTWLAWR